jgi:hypothetical protein
MSGNPKFNKVILGIWNAIKQCGRKKSSQHFLGKVSKEHLSRIVTTDQLHLVKLDNLEMFLEEMEVPDGEYLANFQHERMVLGRVLVKEFRNIRITTVKGQLLIVGWQAVNDNMSDLVLTFAYQDLHQK